MTYNPGAVKQNPDTKTVALATTLGARDPTGGHDWFCLAPANGCYYTDTSHVDSWPDLYTP